METTRCLSKTWIREQHLIRDDLIRHRGAADPARISSLLARVLEGYDAYFRARSESARSDPVQAFTSPASTPLERAAYWISGWRPSILIHILYTESGFKFESQLKNLLCGVHLDDIGAISGAQLRLIDALQRRTIEEEMAIDAELWRIQDDMPDPFPPSDSDLDLGAERIGSVVGTADDLRMNTLREMVRILKPVQAADFLVALADFEIGIRELGLELEQRPIQY